MGRILLIAFIVFVSMQAGAAVIGSMKACDGRREARSERAFEQGHAR